MQENTLLKNASAHAVQKSLLLSIVITPNMALHLVPSGPWTLRDKPA